jgi:hypothetical protein
MAVQSFANSTLAVLRPLWPEFDLWVVHRIYDADVWCARRVGEQTACINANSPEQLIGALQELAAEAG